MNSKLLQHSRYPTLCIIVDIITIIAFTMMFGKIHNTDTIHGSLLVITVLMVLVIFPLMSVYRIEQQYSLSRQLRSLIMAWIVLFIALQLIIIQIQMQSKGIDLISWFAIGTVALIISRTCLWLLQQFWHKYISSPVKILIYGSGPLGVSAGRKIANQQAGSMQIIGYMDDNEDLHGNDVEGVRIFGGFFQLQDVINSKKIDELWIALPLREESLIREIQNELRYSTVTIRLLPDIFTFRLLNHSISEYKGLPLLNISITPMMGINKLIKDIEDRFI